MGKTAKPALGEQGRSALRLVAGAPSGESPWRIADRLAGELDPEPAADPGVLGVPSIAAERIAADHEAARIAGLELEVAALRLRVADLEHDLRLAELRLAEARDEGPGRSRARRRAGARGLRQHRA